MTRLRSVGFFAPSGYVTTPAIVDRAAAFFAGRGWQVRTTASVGARDGRFAGPDALRLADLLQVANDPALDVALCVRGGYGMTRLLDGIDFAAIAERARRGAAPRFVGYSDFTAFHLAYLARAGGIGFQGPGAADFARAGDGDADAQFTVERFFATVTQAKTELEFATPAADLDVRGRLWGGNLTMVCHLLGTRYFPSVRGGILFLEDVNEAAYRIERMLLQLHHAGVLQRQKAILLGDFSALPAMANDNGYGLDSAIAALRARCATPVVTGLPFGHGARRATLPVGGRARCVVRSGVARLECSHYGLPDLHDSHDAYDSHNPHNPHDPHPSQQP